MIASGTLTDIPGLLVGHYTDAVAATGCTVVLCEAGALAAVAVRGAAPATHETDLLRPGHTVQQVHAIVLTGGSAFGLAAVSGVMRYLEERAVGYPTSAGVVPIVPAAALYDLAVGSATVRPGHDEGYSAAQGATAEPVVQGSVGAGTGATVGHLRGLAACTKGGIGSAARALGSGATVGALVAVNAFGDVVSPASGRVLAGTRGTAGYLGTAEHIEELDRRLRPSGQNTTLAVVATDAALDRAGLQRVASMAHDGLARTISPCHTGLDGDTVFALSTALAPAANPTIIGSIAAEVLAAAVCRAVETAAGLGGVPSAREVVFS